MIFENALKLITDKNYTKLSTVKQIVYDIKTEFLLLVTPSKSHCSEKNNTNLCFKINLTLR